MRVVSFLGMTGKMRVARACPSATSVILIVILLATASTVEPVMRLGHVPSGERAVEVSSISAAAVVDSHIHVSASAGHVRDDYGMLLPACKCCSRGVIPAGVADCVARVAPSHSTETWNVADCTAVSVLVNLELQPVYSHHARADCVACETSLPAQFCGLHVQRGGSCCPSTAHYSMSSLHYSESIDLSTQCNELYSQCNELYSQCNELYSQCSELYSLCNELYSLCNELYSLCNELYSQCSELYSQCGEL
jgi:hypothetical protein